MLPYIEDVVHGLDAQFQMPTRQLHTRFGSITEHERKPEFPPNRVAELSW